MIQFILLIAAAGWLLFWVIRKSFGILFKLLLIGLILGGAYWIYLKLGQPRL